MTFSLSLSLSLSFLLLVLQTHDVVLRGGHVIDPANGIDRVMDVDDPQFRGRAMLGVSTWFADFPDPDNFLRPLFHSKGYMNTFGYRNAEVDRLLDQVWSETSYSARNELYHQIETLILKDAPIIPSDYGRLRYLLRPSIRGFTLTPLGAPYLKMKDIWFAEEEAGPEVEL